LQRPEIFIRPVLVAESDERCEFDKDHTCSIRLTRIRGKCIKAQCLLRNIHELFQPLLACEAHG
jgi:hypothetical protein